jgi:hypothetical protein
MCSFRFFIIIAILVTGVIFSPKQIIAQEAKQDSQDSKSKDNTGVGSSTTAHMYGEFTLTTNYVNEGISETNSSFGMQPEAGYAFPRAKIGLWGSNVQFPTNTESLNLRPFGWYDIVFGSNIDLKAKFVMSMYFRSNDRNANIFSLDFNYLTHHIIIENTSNWFGTGQGSYWIAYSREFKAFWDVDFKFEGGMQYMSSPLYSPYLAAKGGLGYKYIDLYYELMLTYNINSSEFPDGIADPSVLFQLTAKF